MADKKPKLTVEESEGRTVADEARVATAERGSGSDRADGDEGGAPSAGGSASGDAGSSDGRGNPFRNVASATSGWLSSNFPGHEYAVFGGLCGLIVAILVFVIGFWQAIFLVICVTVGVAIGQYVDGNPTVVRFVRRFFGEGN